MTAQGNALGYWTQMFGSPERTRQFMKCYCRALSGLLVLSDTNPRALPWDFVPRPVGAFGKTPFSWSPDPAADEGPFPGRRG